MHKLVGTNKNITPHENRKLTNNISVPLYLFGTLSFLSVSTGMWFFAVSSKMFYWYVLVLTPVNVQLNK